MTGQKTNDARTASLALTVEETQVLRLAINFTSEADYLSTAEDKMAEVLWRRLIAAELTLVKDNQPSDPFAGIDENTESDARRPAVS